MVLRTSARASALQRQRCCSSAEALHPSKAAVRGGANAPCPNLLFSQCPDKIRSHLKHLRCSAHGAQDFSKDERAALALKARAHAPVFGGPDRQAVTDEVHAEMLQREPQVPAPPLFCASPSASSPQYACRADLRCLQLAGAICSAWREHGTVSPRVLNRLPVHCRQMPVPI